MAKKEYLRGRPFLTVEVTHRPAAGVNTKVKGWMSVPGAMQSFEKVSFLDRINDVSKYGVVIDILNSTVVSNKSSLGNEEVLATYLSQYKQRVIEAMSVWAQREAKKLADAGDAGVVIEAETTPNTDEQPLDACNCHEEGIDCDHSVAG